MAKRNKPTPTEQLTDATVIYRAWAEKIQDYIANEGATVVDAILAVPPAAYIVDNYVQARMAVSLEKQRELANKLAGGSGNIDNIMAQVDALRPYTWTPPE